MEKMQNNVPKRIIYVEKRDIDDLCAPYNDPVEKYLEARYDVTKFVILMQMAVFMDKIRDEAVPYHALVTNIPYDKAVVSFLHDNQNLERVKRLIFGKNSDEFYDALYKTSLQIIKDAKNACPSMRIIAYSGADIGAYNYFLKHITIDGFVARTENWQIDLENILREIEKEVNSVGNKVSQPLT